MGGEDEEGSQEQREKCALVLDTSVLLTSTERIKVLLHNAFLVVIPAIVMSELDKLKDAGNSAARTAAVFLENQSAMLHIQSEMDARSAIAEFFTPMQNDDRVLLCALQLASRHPQLHYVRVVSRDANLRNRANALHRNVRGCAIDSALAPLTHDEDALLASETEAMEFESPLQQRSAAITALSDSRQVLQAALMAAMRESLPPEDVHSCLRANTPRPEEPWDVRVVLREMKHKWVSVCSDKLPREVYDGIHDVQLPSISSEPNTGATASNEHTCASTIVPLALACEQYIAKSTGVTDERERQRLQKALSRLREWYDTAIRCGVG